MSLLRAKLATALLAIESVLTIPFFVASWLVIAIGFSAMAGFQMAKAAGAEKRAMLNRIFGVQ